MKKRNSNVGCVGGCRPSSSSQERASPSYAAGDGLLTGVPSAGVPSVSLPALLSLALAALGRFHPSTAPGSRSATCPRPGFTPTSTSCAPWSTRTMRGLTVQWRSVPIRPRPFTHFASRSMLRYHPSGSSEFVTGVQPKVRASSLSVGAFKCTNFRGSGSVLPYPCAVASVRTVGSVCILF
jgi:hypothetical protein